MSVPAPKLSPDEKKWRAQDDAQTLARAEEIKMDKMRHSMASKEAINMAKEHQKKADSMKKIAKKKK
jgi:hypothetical protein